MRTLFKAGYEPLLRAKSGRFFQFVEQLSLQFSPSRFLDRAAFGGHILLLGQPLLARPSFRSLGKCEILGRFAPTFFSFGLAYGSIALRKRFGQSGNFASGNKLPLL
jgi:hypothetical protein